MRYKKHTDTLLHLDDVFALVLDLGSASLKAGYAGEIAPTYTVPTVRAKERL